MVNAPALELDTSRPNGVAWYVGAPQTGKTTAACVHARQWASELGRPILVVDSMGTRDFANLRHYDDLTELVEAVWTRGESAAIQPAQVADVDRVCNAARAGGDVVVLVDEAHFWTRASNPLLRLMRGTQHSRTRVLCTTQHLSGDVPQAALACDPDLFVFRTSSPRSLERLEREFGVPSDVARSLPRYGFLYWRSA